MAGMEKIMIQLNIPADQYLLYYQGAVRSIQIRSTDGRLVRFPAAALKKFVEHDGIRGLFELAIEGSKIRDIRRIA